MTLGRVLGLVLGMLFDFDNHGRKMVAKASKVPTLNELYMSQRNDATIVKGAFLPNDRIVNNANNEEASNPLTDPV